MLILMYIEVEKFGQLWDFIYWNPNLQWELLCIAVGKCCRLHAECFLFKDVASRPVWTDTGSFYVLVSAKCRAFYTIFDIVVTKMWQLSLELSIFRVLYLDSPKYIQTQGTWVRGIWPYRRCCFWSLL